MANRMWLPRDRDGNELWFGDTVVDPEGGSKYKVYRIVYSEIGTYIDVGPREEYLLNPVDVVREGDG